MAEEGVKLRSVCDGCTSAKLRCNGKVPCERCLKKGIECHYQPFKHRGGAAHLNNKAKAVSKPVDSGDNFLDEYERKVWSVFFTLYRGFGKGCSLFWFKQQLFRMSKFLEDKASDDPNAANAYNRLTSWMGALGLDAKQPPTNHGRALPHLPFATANPPNFQGSLDDLRSEAQRRNLPMFQVDRDGRVEINEAFISAFPCSQENMQQVLNDSGGGFLPWSGDLLARILTRESDLVMYLQGVSNTMDAIGKPPGVPCIQVIPSMCVLHATKRDGQEVICIVRAVQQLHLDVNDFTFSSTVVIELPDDNMTGNIPQQVASRMRPYSATSMAADESLPESKKFLEEPDDILPLPQEILLNPVDEEWLEGLLSWATEDQLMDGQAVPMLPFADEAMLQHLDLSAGQRL